MSSRHITADDWRHGTGEGDIASRRPAWESTQRLAPRGPTEPTLADFERLANGELEQLCLADRYRVEARLGSGGMADVYAAENLVTGRALALKLPTRYYAIYGRALLSEARLCARIQHANVIDILDSGSMSSGITYLVMERLRGQDLRALLDRVGRLSWAEARAIILQICAGLTAVHAAGVLHRDIKPENVFCVETGGPPHIKLIDFGVASLFGAAVHEAELRWGHHFEPPGSLSGTPSYMAPEQIRGEPGGVASDIYAVGVILCELLTGRVPFDAPTCEMMLSAHLYDERPTLASLEPKLDLDPRVQQIHARALAIDPRDRFASVEEMSRAIAEIPAEPLLPTGPLPPPAADAIRPPRAFWPVGLVALVVGMIAALIMLTNSRGELQQCARTEAENHDIGK